MKETFWMDGLFGSTVIVTSKVLGITDCHGGIPSNAKSIIYLDGSQSNIPIEIFSTENTVVLAERLNQCLTKQSTLTSNSADKTGSVTGK